MQSNAAQPIQHVGFWDQKLAPQRKLYFKIVLTTVLILTVCQWIFLPIYYGSTWKSPQYVNRLNGWIIDRDGSDIGQAVLAASSRLTGSQHQLSWSEVASSSYPTDESLVQAIKNSEDAWCAIVINADATSNYESAVSNGDASYNGSFAVTIWISEARNNAAVDGYVSPQAQAIVRMAAAAFAAQTLPSILRTASGNTTALNALATAPQTLYAPFSFTLNNLSPYNVPVAVALQLVGLIYLLLFSFTVTMANTQARELFRTKIYFGSLMLLRFVVPLLASIWISLQFVLIALAFHVPLNRVHSNGKGVIIYWAALYLGQLALGLAMESMITVLTPKFIVYFMICWIVLNVSTGGTVDMKLQPWIYRYGVAFPFFNINSIVKNLLFGTKDILGRNFGILLAWTFLSLLTMPLFVFLSERKGREGHLPSDKRLARTHVEEKQPIESPPV